MNAWHSCKHSLSLAVGTDAEKLSMWPYLVFSQNGHYIVQRSVQIMKYIFKWNISETWFKYCEIK